jgi:hypothetical protein
VVRDKVSYSACYAPLVRRQHRVSLAAVFPDNDNCAIANGQSGTEQFGHFLGKRRGEGNRAPGDGIADTNRTGVSSL